MIARICCWILGHEWAPWTIYRALDVPPLSDEVKGWLRGHPSSQSISILNDHAAMLSSPAYVATSTLRCSRCEKVLSK